MSDSVTWLLGVGLVALLATGVADANGESGSRGTFTSAGSGVMLIADARPGKQSAGPKEHILGVCGLTKWDEDDQGFAPTIEANLYFNTNPEKIQAATAKMRVLQEPKNGTLQIPDPIWGAGKYRPVKGYVGNDSYVIEVKGSGHTVKIRYFVRVVEGDGESIFDNKNCKGQVWKISRSSADRPNTVIAAMRLGGPNRVAS